MMSCWSQRPRCQAHVMDAMNNPFPRSPAALVLFIRAADYCKAHAQRRCSREDRKPHMVQKSSGRSAVRVPQTSRSAAAATHGSRRNPTWTQESAQPTYTVFVRDRPTRLPAPTQKLDGSLLRVYAFLWSSVIKREKRKTKFCSGEQWKCDINESVCCSCRRLEVRKLSWYYFKIELFRFGFYSLTFDKRFIISTNQVQGYHTWQGVSWLMGL